MNIGIIGAGRVGSSLGGSLARAGHSILYGARDPGRDDARLRHPGAEVVSVAEAAARADAVILATPWSAAQAALEAAGDLGGKPLLDATNPIGPGLSLTHAGDDSGGEQVQRWAPTARVVKVFNSTGAENMADPRYGESASLMLACSDDDAALAIALQLAADIGFEAHGLGPLKNARLIEPFARVWIDLALVRGQGRGIAFGLLRR